MRNPPPSEYLSWPAPNYVDPQTLGPMLIAVPTVLAIISFLIVALRLYTRFVLIKNVGADDWLIGASIVSLKISFLFNYCTTWWLVEWRLEEERKLRFGYGKKLILNCEIVYINYTSCFHYPWFVLF